MAPGFFFCISPDAVLARDKAMELLEERAREENAPYTVRTFWAEEGLENTGEGLHFWEALTLRGLLPSREALFVRGAQSLNAETWKRLSSTLSSPPAAFPVFFMEGVWEKGQPKIPAHITKLPCYTFAEKKTWVWKSAGLDARSLRTYVQDQANSLQLRFEGKALESLCALLAPDAQSVKNTLDQLYLLATADRPDRADASSPLVVKESHVAHMEKFHPEAAIFDIIRQLQTGKALDVWASLLREGDGGEEMLFALLSLLAREGRVLWQLQAGEEVFLPASVAAQKRQLAKRLGFQGIGEIWEAVMDAEVSIKTGKYQPLQALEYLLARLQRLFAG